MSHPSPGQYHIVPLEGPLTIYTAAEHKALLLQSLQPGAEVELDLTGVDELDCAGLQLLVLAKQEASRMGCRLQLANHSPAVIDAFELSGLGSFFGDPILIQPSQE